MTLHTPTEARGPLPLDRIEDFCRKWRVEELAIFGSVLRDDFRPESDIDVLVEFEPGRSPGFGFIRVQDELSEIFGRNVDLGTPKSLSRYIRDKVLAEAEAIYPRA